jgi:hypothetical protein
MGFAQVFHPSFPFHLRLPAESPPMFVHDYNFLHHTKADDVRQAALVVCVHTIVDAAQEI